jgi:hypothetical protein
VFQNIRKFPHLHPDFEQLVPYRVFVLFRIPLMPPFALGMLTLEELRKFVVRQSRRR